MRKLILFAIVISVCILFVSCKETGLTCNITNPANNAEFNADEAISVTVVAEDANGTIAEVQLYVDDVGHSIKNAFPYNFTINARELSTGTHTLKAIAKNKKGLSGESSVVIKVNPPSTESPDFVTFSDGKIPNTWQTTKWVVDNTIGYDDIFSLKATANNVAVTTSKTCNSNINCIEFYARNGSVNFFVDSEKVLECSSGSNWKQYSVFLKEGFHSFKWESSSDNVNIDAIHFKRIYVGMPYQGGIVAYVDKTGGLIAAPYDQSEGIQWYNGTFTTTGATGYNIGTGKSNTVKIVQEQGSGNYAAKLCDDLILNGYSDWFLPSRRELDELYNNKDVIGGFNSDIYWSSSEQNSNTALGRSMTGVFHTSGKDQTFRVRAVRAF